MKIIAALYLAWGIFAVPAIAQDVTVYRYEWVPQGQSQPTPLGTGRSGYIDLLAPSSDFSQSQDLSAVYDMQFTTPPNAGQSPPGQPANPPVPAATWGVDDARSGTTQMIWNGQAITYLDNIQLVGTVAGQQNFTAAILSDSSIQSFWPETYLFNEDSQSGAWLYEGSFTVPESETGLWLMASVAIALTILRHSRLNGRTSPRL